ncbi:LuxR C-terminal-related transcriptional regulator [Humibacillus xanthopallidus]|uniref:LuxR C-terminal-related transcriptional regulator n=1 Tax=Humibacillus xanthopallidus TaxID=412689 RepID=UPI00115197FB|nr:LuxR C-terminal-related transcriptional regulator [Humibacillus xanthopallidus]
MAAATERPLTVVAAGPASGKTVAVSEWVRSRRAPTAWVSLEPADNASGPFWGLVDEALEQVGRAVPSDIGGGRPAPEETLERLAAVVSADDPLYLVLDDAHVLRDPGLVQQLDALLQLPLPGLHVILSARSDPLVALHRYRIAGLLSELRAVDLAMSPTEVDDLIAAHGLALDPSARALLMERTEGWVAGLRLSMVRMESSDRPEDFVTAFAMDRGSIGEFLLEEVLASLDPHSRRMLIRTSVCEAICGSLADAICDDTGGADILARLAQGGSFVSPLEHEMGWYRYHPLMREVLVHLLASEPATLRRLVNARAARWHDERGNLVEALHHAVTAHDCGHAADLLSRGAFSRIFLGSGERVVSDLQGFVQTPRSHLEGDVAAGTERVLLTAAQAAVAGATGEMTALRTQLLLIGDEPEAPGTRMLADYARLVLAMHDGYADTATMVAERMTAEDPDGPFGAFALSQIGAIALWCGNEDRAIEYLTRALTRAHGLGMTPLALECIGLLGIQHCSLGRVATAEDYVMEGSRLVRSHPRLTGRAQAALFVAAGEVAIARGRLDEFELAMERASDALGNGADPALSSTVTLLRAKALQAVGQYVGAMTLLVEDPSLRSPGSFNLVTVGRTMTAELSSLSGWPLRPPDEVVAAAASNHHVSGLVGIARARAELASGQLDSAERHVRRVVASSRPAPSLPVLVEAVLIGSEVALAAGDERRAVERVTHAIDLGNNGGVVLPFVEAARRLLPLITRHHGLEERWPIPLEGMTHEIPNARTTLPESLTDRELSVLRWLTTTLSVSEIADELCLSINTIKTHVAAVYRKLGVGRRRDAVARGRELRLL